jgi:ABC-type uncharacterized transport system substrate-binding protein
MQLPDKDPGTSKYRMRYSLSASLAVVLTIVLVFSGSEYLHATTKANILFVSSQTSTPYLQFIDKTRQELQAGDPLPANIISLSAGQLTASAMDNTDQSYDLIVALGQKAALAVSQWNTDTPVLYTLIPKTTYESLEKSGKLACPHKQCSAVYIDQPLKRLLHILAIAFGRQHLGVLLGPSSVQQKDALLVQAHKAGFTLHTATARQQDDVLPALDSILQQSALLLSLADPVVYNRRTAKSILLTTYRHRVPVAAYSRAYADAGATLSIYSTPGQIAEQATDVIKTFFNSHKPGLPAPQYPKHYSIRINKHVAESLGLDLEANPELQSIMKKAENE